MEFQQLTTEKDMYETADVNELLSMAVRCTLMQEYLLISVDTLKVHAYVDDAYVCMHAKTTYMYSYLRMYAHSL